MTRRKFRKALRTFLGGNPLPKTKKARRRVAAEFVDWLGTMNQPDRDDSAHGQYATDSWEDREQQQAGHEWKNDERDDIGMGIPRSAMRKAVAASDLAFTVLGEDNPDKVLERQARDFHRMPYRSIVATNKRIKVLLASDDNPEFDAQVDDDEDTTESLADAFDAFDELDPEEEEVEEDAEDEECDDCDIYDDDEEGEADEDDDDYGVDMDGHELDDTSDSDITGEDEDAVLRMIAEGSDTTKARKASRVPKGRRRTAQKLGNVVAASPRPGSNEIAGLQKLWKSEPRVNWDSVDQLVFED